MNKLLANLEQKRSDLKAEAAAIFKAVQDEGRTLTAEEKKSVETIEAKIGDVDESIKLAKRQEDREREIIRNFDKGGEQAQDPDAGKALPFYASPGEQKPKLAPLGEFLAAVIKAGIPNGGEIDPRLRPTAGPSGLNTYVDSEGGFLVQEQYTEQFLNRAMSESQVASRCTEIPIGDGFDGINAPIVDETSRATGSRWGGIQIYRAAQADTVTATKPKLGQFKLDLLKLMGICYLTDEAMADATALAAIVSRGFGEEFAWVLDNEVLFGNGAGQCLGVMNSAALVSVTKETNQAAATIVAQNIIKMRARLLARLRGNSVWFVNQDCEPQLHTLSLPVGTGGLPVYLPANGLAGAPYDTLYGRPVVPIEQCQTLGTTGDIIYANMGEYAIITKGGVRQDSSMHVRFIYGENTLRWTVRNNGAPIWKTSLTPAKGSNTLSPFVALATRS